MSEAASPSSAPLPQRRGTDGPRSRARQPLTAPADNPWMGTSLWSISRGLARHAADYKQSLMAADEPRRSDVDGRGALSEAALADFCEFFLRTCIDQVDFMASVLEPATLLARIEAWLAEEVRSGTLHKRSSALIREAFQTGSIDRGRVPAITDLGERQARIVLSKLIERGVLASASHRAPVYASYSQVRLPSAGSRTSIPASTDRYGGAGPPSASRIRRARAGRPGSRAPIRSTVFPGRASAATHSTTAA